MIEQSIKSIKSAVEWFEVNKLLFNYNEIVTHAAGFSTDRFKKEIQDYIISRKV